MIQPTVGCVVLFHPAEQDGDMIIDPGQPVPALVVKVWNDSLVNLAAFDANGRHFARTSVRLVQPGDPKPSSYYCEWMPYEIGQAQKTKALETALREEGK